MPVRQVVELLDLAYRHAIESLLGDAWAHLRIDHDVCGMCRDLVRRYEDMRPPEALVREYQTRLLSDGVP